jgi:hypothetical protein
MGPMKLKSKSAWLLHFAAALLIVWPWQLDNSTAPQFPVRERSPDRSRRVTGAWECVAAPEHFVVSCAGIRGSFRTVGGLGRACPVLMSVQNLRTTFGWWLRMI